MLELWEIRGTPSLHTLQRPLWPGVVVPDSVLSMGQMKLFDIQIECKRMTYAYLKDTRHSR